MEGAAVALKRFLEALIAACFAVWAVYWILVPLGYGKRYMAGVDTDMTSKFMGAPGSVFIFQAAPILLAAILSFVVIELRKRTPSDRILRREGPSLKLKHAMHAVVFARSPLGVLTVIDISFLAFIFSLVLWSFAKSSYVEVRDVNRSPHITGAPANWTIDFVEISVNLARSALIPFALLWIPVTRGSPLLRVIRLPWEHAVRYHIWLAQIALSLFAAHAATFIVFFAANHQVKHVFTWRTSPGAAVICGFCALIIGLVMWLTALPIVRRKQFDLFYNIHQFYVAFFILFACHVVSAVYYVAIPVLLYFIDRFIRLVQSRKNVEILKARLLPSGAVELKFLTPPNFVYHPLSVVFVLLPSVSRLQWHPFSVTSSRLDKKSELSICIKPIGGWTRGITDIFSGRKVHRCPFSFKASLEGPYGDEADFYLNYKTLVLIAGGIGITPFLAILRDILYRYKMNQEGLPEVINLFYCARKPIDLAILNTLDPRDILPDFQSIVKIRIHAYCTSTTIADYPASLENKPSGTVDLETYGGWSFVYAKPTFEIQTQAPDIQGVSLLSAAGSSVWVATTIVAAILGFMVLWGLANVIFIHHNEAHYKNYKESVLFLASAILAVVVCGGCVILLWSITLSRADASQGMCTSGCKGLKSTHVRRSNLQSPNHDLESAHRSPWRGDLHLGLRPNWNEVFDQLTKHYDGQEVGVLVSGPDNLKSDVAQECGHHTACRGAVNAVFHFHSVSFEL
ncbi:ferric-chelate reductase [Marchantia polymorpha subsp. ruderalis]|uniref:FAD-binding FR-type domain-containing protein n=2 Tax=Marchantia polymorpha TaxID=3197 RepID=A0A176WK74_MARPO|nr:hypothetical protein AXG93_1200s1260 [Marchantia polymorpha subsp. ruderalis]PTQ49847.1 hypothetical protein MARPO_0002s0287 [Marchantia polymorpha]BBN00036.1 hypothetical protein Mp_1g25890 [Marchantia polymorpha subsp. ruderalis]|eukprot:PTQ49847.1 hypothetical protein MARPO_0002s0287 [Marchantia polymorpha]